MACGDTRASAALTADSVGRRARGARGSVAAVQIDPDGWLRAIATLDNRVTLP